MTTDELAELYRDQFLALLPPGRIWPESRDSSFQALALALGYRLAEAHETLLRWFVQELDPRATIELLPEWEEALGLPDPCTPAAQTIQERRQRVVAALTVRPSPTLQYLRALAEALGYAGALLIESPPFSLTITVPNPRVTYARTGASRCGDYLARYERASDLECVLQKQKPAHITLVFNYSGV